MNALVGSLRSKQQTVDHLDHNSTSIQFELHDDNPIAPVYSERQLVERFITAKYQQAYQAHVSLFMPLLLSLKRAGNIQAAVGVRSAAYAPLFLENYVDSPIEQEIASIVRQPVDRNHIVEIGNLVAGYRGGSQVMFVVMAAALELAGYQWLVFTATPQVEKLIKRLHFQPNHLAIADGQRLGLQSQEWGSYYACQPQVMCGDIFQAMEIARRTPSIEKVLSRYATEISEMASVMQSHRRLNRS
jgi:hypothetical protein